MSDLSFLFHQQQLLKHLGPVATRIGQSCAVDMHDVETLERQFP